MSREGKKRRADMRAMRLNGATYQEIAEKYGVSKQYVHKELSKVGYGRKVLDDVVYRGLREWMIESGLSVRELHRLISSSTTESNSTTTKRKLVGNAAFKVSEIILIIQESGMTFEELFMKE